MPAIQPTDVFGGVVEQQQPRREQGGERQRDQPSAGREAERCGRRGVLACRRVPGRRGQQQVDEQPQRIEETALLVPAGQHTDAEHHVDDEQREHGEEYEQMGGYPGTVDEHQPGDERDQHQVAERVRHADRALEHAQRAVGDIGREQEGPAQHQGGHTEDRRIDEHGPVRLAPAQVPQPGRVQRVRAEVEGVRQ